jgi:hypothetical protein
VPRGVRVTPLPPGYHREQKLKKRYNMTQAQFDEELEAQAYGCKICGRESKNWKVDHDHKRGFGHFRGILCTSCNTALGLVNDDPNILRRMIGYLQDH